MPEISNAFLEKNDISEKFPKPPQRSPINVNSVRQSIEFEGKNYVKKPGQFSIDDYENEEHEENRSMFERKEK